MTSFTITLDGERLTLRLHSLAEYEADGGRYSDAGEDVSRERADFLAALSVEDEAGYDLPTILDAAGVAPADRWIDSSTSYVLLKDWPAEAPLAARLVRQASWV